MKTFVLNLLTFKSKFVEFSSHIIDHDSAAGGIPQPGHSFDEVRHHLVDGVGVRGDVFGFQHARIQDAADALPLGPHSTKTEWQHLVYFPGHFLEIVTYTFVFVKVEVVTLLRLD